MILSFIHWLGSFWDNSPNGGSMRKVVTVWIMILITRIHSKYLNYAVNSSGDFDFAITLIYCDYTMIASLLGLIVLQKLVDLFINLKLGTKDDEKNKSKSVDTTN